MRCKINLLGQNDCINFCNAAMSITGDASLITKNGKYRVNAKSLLGCMLAISEWGDDVWLETDSDHYTKFEPWIETAAEDGAFIHE